MIQHEDATGRIIDVGDTILYTMSTDGRAASMELGRVTRFTEKTLWVWQLDITTREELMRDEGFWEKTGKTEVFYAGTNYERIWEETVFVKTHEVPVGEQQIPKPSPYRFYILEKV